MSYLFSEYTLTFLILRLNFPPFLFRILLIFIIEIAEFFIFYRNQFLFLFLLCVCIISSSRVPYYFEGKNYCKYSTERSLKFYFIIDLFFFPYFSKKKQNASKTE